MMVECRVCKSSTTQSGYLYRCLNLACGAAHWDKRAVMKERLSDPEVLKLVLETAAVPPYLKGQASHFVYILRLRGSSNSAYVGMTGLHPLERYLNHLRGHKASRVAHSRATSLIAFEGPMTAKKAAAREVSLAEKLGAAGMQIFGGH
jgi:predicted GIY-YIG superfamily endonuclease